MRQLPHLFLIAVATACGGTHLDDDDAAPDAMQQVPDAAEPSGATRLASGNYLQLAAHVAGGNLYAVEYSDTSLIAHAVRIVAIDTATGVATTIADVESGTSLTALQTTDDALYWLQITSAGNAIYRKKFAASDAPPELVLAANTKSFGDRSLDAFVPVASDNAIYVLSHVKSQYELGSVPINPPSNSAPETTGTYSVILDGDIAGASEISLQEGTVTVGMVGNLLFAGGYAIGGSSGGFVQEFNIGMKTSRTIVSHANTHVESFIATATHLFWIQQGADVRLQRTDGLGGLGSGTGTDGHTGGIATLADMTWGLAPLGDALFATSLEPGATALWSVGPSTPIAEPPTGVATQVLTVPTCPNQTDDCAAKISSIATDDANLYFTATDAVYRYTPQ
jgi:hypothetical protein